MTEHPTDERTVPEQTEREAAARRRASEASDHNVTLDAQDDDWAWRRRLRANPVTARIYRIAVAVVGGVVVAGGLVAVPAPGPGWLIVFAGVGIWATEFEWAQRLLRWGKGVLAEWTHWMGRQPVWLRGLIGLATLVLVLLIFWGLFAITGVPGLLPDAVEDRCAGCPGSVEAIWASAHRAAILTLRRPPSVGARTCSSAG